MVRGSLILEKILRGPFACETVGGGGGVAGTAVAGALTRARFAEQSKPSFH